MNKKISFGDVWERFGTFIIFIVMIFVVGLIAPRQFLATNNLIQIVVQSSTTMLISYGEFFAILIAGIDLSVGSMLAFSSMVSAKLMVTGMNPVLAILIGSIIFGGFLGWINGSLVNLTGLHPFVITLGTNAIFRGLTLVISNAIPVFGFPQSFKTAFGGMQWGWLPMPIFWAILVALILKFVTEKTILGRNFYAIGGSKESAWFSGINVKSHTLMVFIISGICAGMAGAVQLARIGSAEPMAGNGDETFAIASVIIGGASFFGGKGRISGVLVGALIIGLISNALNMLSVPTYYQQVVTGSLIIGTVTIDMFVAKKNK
jgi:D-allose transport system permease protein